MDVPSYDNLPPVKGMPKGCAWGVFDQDGKKDLLGTLNHLTPEVVKAAAAEVKEGRSISLDWPLDAMSSTMQPGRQKMTHTHTSLADAGVSPTIGWDDEVSYNTQGSSQWDSLVHWMDQPSGLAYNGANPTPEDLKVSSTAENALPTLDHWHTRGGMVARGVLIDFPDYARHKGIEFHPYTGYRISVAEMEAAAKYHGVEFRPGDVLILRTGATETIDNLTADDKTILGQGRISGMDGNEESAAWLWNHKFAAVASDSNGFEAVPPINKDGSPAHIRELFLHGKLLSLFGMPIGELWDLTKLAKSCKERGRYSFMLTSTPLNVPCLVGSPPNALAIF